MTTTSKVTAAEVEYLPEDYFRPLPLEQLYPRPGPLEVDAGCGEGAFLAAMAQRHPERNFLGLERLYTRLRNCCKKAAKIQASNVRLLRVETGYAAQYLLPKGSVSRFYVLFPDPWPKRRHWPRRLVQPEFLNSVAGALEPDGELCIKTDDADYFAHISRVAAGCERFATANWEDAGEMPPTGFEKRFLERGLKIHSLRLRRKG